MSEVGPSLANLEEQLNSLQEAIAVKKDKISGLQQDLFASNELAEKATTGSNDNDEGMSKEQVERLSTCLDSLIGNLQDLLKEEANGQR